MSPGLPKRRLARAINLVINEMLDDGSLVQLTDQNIVYPPALPSVGPEVKSQVTQDEYEALVRACYIAEGFTGAEFEHSVAPAIQSEWFDNDGMPIVAYDTDYDEDGRTQYDRIKWAIEKVAEHFEPAYEGDR